MPYLRTAHRCELQLTSTGCRQFAKLRRFLEISNVGKPLESSHLPIVRQELSKKKQDDVDKRIGKRQEMNQLKEAEKTASQMVAASRKGTHFRLKNPCWGDPKPDPLLPPHTDSTFLPTAY